ncbi:MAG: hypothetical protein F6K10_33775 [Moorea sp. SIO2B7]|nr:hypothetical protein [Moorena sp. SIO2B7]
MNLPTILNIAIGLIIIYLTFSLVVSEVQELITTLLEWRAKTLKEGIAQLFGENSSEDPLVIKFYNNPLIKSLTQKATNKASSKGPSYISASSFAYAFMEIIRLGKEIPKSLDDLMNDVVNNPNLPDSLKKNISCLSQQAKSKAEDASQELKQMEREIENWFNSSMDRLSGVYKRNCKAVVLIIAFIIAILANVDTIYIIDSLSQEQNLHSTIDKIANQVISENSCSQISYDDQDNEKNQTECLSFLKTDVNQTYKTLSPLPLGWDLSAPLQKQLTPLNLKNIVKIFLGWFLSAIAISMGAPFWFDLLDIIINVRNTGKKINTRSWS